MIPTTKTVETLRSEGYKISITHWRRPKAKRKSQKRLQLEKNPKIAQDKRPPGLYLVSEFKNRANINPNGGRTEMEIVSPHGKVLTVHQNVFGGDPYCKETGLALCFNKIFKQIPQ